MPSPSRPPKDRLERLETAVDAYLEDAANGSRPANGPASDAADGPSSLQLERLLEIASALNRIHDRDLLLTKVGDWLRELFDAENSFVVLFEEDGQARILSAHLKDPSGDPDPVSATILERVRKTRAPILIDDTSTLPDLKSRGSIERNRIISVLCAPLVVENKVIGALQFDQRDQPHPFQQADLKLLSLFAAQAATAFYNLQLVESYNQALQETKDAQWRLVQVERLSAVGEMAAGMAHDFNNTLFVALGFCDVLLERPGLDSLVRSSLEKIRTCSLDAANTVRRLQLFARGRSEEGQPTPLELGPLVEQMPEFTRRKWCDEALRHGRTIEVTTRCASAPHVMANAADVREILTNLIFNAVDAMPGGGTITLATGQEVERGFVSVRDEGTGMDDATRQRVFEPFFSTKGPGGSGFGLTTCWSLAQRLGGELSIESEPGKGSCFTLWLPIAGSEAEVPGPADTLRPASGHVLLVDDDPDVLETMAQLMLTMGYRVTSFTSARRALEAFESGSFDAVVTDLGMPEVNGVELAQRISEQSTPVPVILVTGWGTDVELEPGVTDSVSAVIAKPVTLEGLRRALAAALPS